WQPSRGLYSFTYTTLFRSLSNATTQVIYEGTPDTPRRTRHLEIIERYGVTTYYTAPTLVRTFMTWFPDGVPATFDLRSIRLLGSDRKSTRLNSSHVKISYA